MEDIKTRNLLNDYLKSIFFRILDIQAKQVSLATHNRLSRTEMHSIEIIKDATDPILTDVAESLRVSKATASVCIDRLVKKGFVNKNIFTGDKRKFTLSLTTTGDTTYEQHRIFHDKMVDAMINDLGIEAYPELLRGLKNLADFFNEY